MDNTKKWVIFFERNGVKYYLCRIYKRIDRIAFSKKRFFVYDSILDVNNVLKEIENIFKLYYPERKLRTGLMIITEKTSTKNLHKFKK